MELGNGPSAGADAAASRPAGAGGILTGAFAKGEYVLPELPYAYDALEPLYDAKTVQLHYEKHHGGAVKGLNEALKKLAAARSAGNFDDVKSLCRALAYNGSSHVLHSLLWGSMTPGGSSVPAPLSAAMTTAFGSVATAQAQFAAAAASVEGSGWAILAYEPISDSLLILQAEKHENLAFIGIVPLLVCDVWEHAYYLKYANDRAAWVAAFMKLANWDFADARFSAARAARPRAATSAPAAAAGAGNSTGAGVGSMVYAVGPGCVGCGRCQADCEVGAIAKDGKVYVIDAHRCVGCGDCANVCPTKVIRKTQV
jgi:Fe-Mn family superoxide dismutase